MKSALSLLMLGVLVAAGCSSVPHGQKRIRAQVDPQDRPMAILPFQPTGGETRTEHGLWLAMMATNLLQDEYPNLRIVGPRELNESLSPADMSAALRGEIDPVAVGRAMGVDLVVSGWVVHYSLHRDDLQRTWVGQIGFRFDVYDVSGGQADRIARTRDERFTIPEELGERFDPKYETMGEDTFQAALFRHGARKVAEFFYDHVVPANKAERPTAIVGTRD